MSVCVFFVLLCSSRRGEDADGRLDRFRLDQRQTRKFFPCIGGLRLALLRNQHRLTCSRTTPQYYEYFVNVLDQDRLTHRAHILGGRSIEVSPPTVTEPFQDVQTSYDPASPRPFDEYGPTRKAPLGLIVHARSGDKGSDANVGFYVSHPDEWPWLRDL